MQPKAHYFETCHESGASSRYFDLVIPSSVPRIQFLGWTAEVTGMDSAPDVPPQRLEEKPTSTSTTTAPQEPATISSVRQSPLRSRILFPNNNAYIM